jgi:O-antigen/teichoic acid export membrane protein
MYLFKNVNKLYIKIGLNTAFQLVGRVLTMGFSVLVISLLTRYLGNHGYGIYTLVFSYLAFFSMLADFGLHLSMIRILTKQIDNPSLIGSYFIIRILFIILSSILSIIFLVFIPYSFEIKSAILIGLLAIDIGILSSIGNAIFQTKLRLDFITIIDLFGKLVTLFGIIVCIRLNLNLISIIFTVVIGNIFSLVLSIFLLIKENKFYLIFDKKSVKKLLILSTPIGISSFLALSYFKIDTIMLSLLKNEIEVSYYGVAYKVFENLLIIWGFYMASAYPIMSTLFENREKFIIFLKNSIKISLFISLLIIVLVYIFSPLIVNIIAGDQYIKSVDSIRILLFSIPFLFINNIYYHIFIIKEKVWILVRILLFILMINIIINLVAIPRYSIIGASFSTVLTELITFLIYSFFVRRYLK